MLDEFAPPTVWPSGIPSAGSTGCRADHSKGGNGFRDHEHRVPIAGAAVRLALWIWDLTRCGHPAAGVASERVVRRLWEPHVLDMYAARAFARWE